MDDKQQQFRNTAIYFIPIVVSALIPFISIPIFTRILSKQEFGLIALAMVYAVFISGIANFGMTAAYDRNFFKYRADKDKSASLLHTSLLFVFFNFFWMGCLTTLYNVKISTMMTHSPLWGNFFYTAVWAQLFPSMNGYFLAAYKNSERASRYTTFTVMNVLLNFVFALIFVAWIRVGAIGLIYSQIIAGVIVFCILAYDFYRNASATINRSIFWDSFKIAYPLTPRIFMGVISTQFDKYMLGILATLGGVGIYDIGQKVSKGVFSCLTALQNVYAPRIYRMMFADKPETRQEIGEYITPFAYLSIAIALTVSLFSEEVIGILTPSSFHGATSIVSILALYYGVLFFGKINGSQLIFKRKTHITSALTLVSITINVLLNIPFILKWGVLGAAWATMLAGVISGVISFRISQNHYRIDWEYGKLAAMLSMLMAFSVVLVTLYEFNTAYWVRIVVKCVALLMYVWLGVRIKIISKKNSDAMLELLTSSVKRLRGLKVKASRVEP